MISISNLSKIYVQNSVGSDGTNDTIETVALKDISFNVKEGEFVAIMGPSGSGKSTLMHIIGALDIPTSGTYILDSQDVGKLTEDELADIRNLKIGFVFQAFNLLPRITALQNVMLPMVYGGIEKDKRKEIAEKYLKMVGLTDRMDHTSSQLSGGQQQRVAIARALTMDPKIILADEPTGNIASNQANEIMRIFEDLNSKGHTIVMITHEPDIAEYANRVIVLKDGSIIDDRINRKKFRGRNY